MRITWISLTVFIGALIVQGFQTSCILKELKDGNKTCDLVNITSQGFTIETANLNMSHIKKIHFLNSTIQSVPSGIFKNFTELSTIYMENVGLTEVTPGSFKDALNLTTIGLDKNQIEVLKADSFEGASNLLNLYLGFNKIKDIDRDAFSGLSNLLYLGLQDNSITDLIPGSFDPLLKIEFIHLKNNQLKIIKNELFQNNQDLRKLSLVNNKITEIDKEIAERMKSFELLNLEGNECASFNYSGVKETFMIQIQNCSISDNGTDRTGARSFDGEPKTEEKTTKVSSNGFMILFIVISLICLPLVIGLVVYLRFVEDNQNNDEDNELELKRPETVADNTYTETAQETPVEQAENLTEVV